MRFSAIIISLLLSVFHLSAQDEPLVADPGRDQFEFCKHLYRQANSISEHRNRIIAYQRLAPRLEAYIQRFPNHQHTPAASYYLGECYYQSGAINEAKRILSRVITRFKKGELMSINYRMIIL